MDLLKNLDVVDTEIQEAINKELSRQRDKLEMIASENIVSKAVMQAQGSVLTNKYAEGYPGKRYYGGCEYVDVVEQLAIDRAKKIIWCRICKCTATFWSTSKYSSIFCFATARRYYFRYEPYRWWSFNTW